jgi:hypothetical protein
MPQSLDATIRVGVAPVMQAGPTGSQGQGCGDPMLSGGPDTADPETEPGEVLTCRWSRWSAATGREEEEARAFLVRVAEWTTVRVRAYASHLATLAMSIDRCSINPGNYS